MPSLRGLTVHVTDNQGNDLAEWGVQRLRQPINGEKVSSYIKSTTDTQFQISVQPRIPFTTSNIPDSEVETDIDRATGAQEENEIRPRRVSKYGPQSDWRRHSASEDVSTNRSQSYKDSDTKISISSPSQQPRECVTHPKYSFLAILYLDGRSMPERKVIIYTDPVDKDFNAPDGKVYFKHRWVQSKDGSITEHAWVFKEKAIETVFNRLVINGSQVQSDAEDEDDIIEAMQASGLDCQKDSGAEETKVGQIVVEIRRVRLGPKKYDPNYRPIHEEGHDDDIDMDGVKPDITHATGFSFTKTVLRSPLRVVEYYDYKPGEDLWATFQFFYRSADQLRSYGFGSPQPRSRIAKTDRTFTSYLARLAPLSITHAGSSTPVKQKKGWNFFKKIVEDGQRKTDFGSDYRDASADDELETEEVSKYPRAQLPFLLSKAPRNGLQVGVTVPGLPNLDTKVVSAVASQANLKQTQSIRFDDADRLLPLPPATRGTSYYLPHVDPRRQSTPYPDLGEASTSPPSRNPPSSLKPASLITDSDRSAPDSKEANIVTLDAFSNDDYRASVLAQQCDSDGDVEDADDELNTESDLETHAGDDVIGYTTDPDKEIEEADEAFEGLRSRFKKVGLKKRMHAEVEDSKDDVDNDSKATEGGLGEDGHGEKMVGSSLRGKSQKHVRPDKKARTSSADRVGATIEAILSDLNSDSVSNGTSQNKSQSLQVNGETIFF